MTDKTKAKIASSMLLAIAERGCNYCQKTECKLRCMGCQLTYCDIKCQQLDWNSHRHYCPRITFEMSFQQITDVFLTCIEQTFHVYLTTPDIDSSDAEVLLLQTIGLGQVIQLRRGDYSQYDEIFQCVDDAMIKLNNIRLEHKKRKEKRTAM